MASKTEENTEAQQVLKLKELINNTSTKIIFLLTESLKQDYGVTEGFMPTATATAEPEKATEEVATVVNLRIAGWAKELTSQEKVGCYNVLSQIAKEFGRADINMVKAKKMIEENDSLANNVDSTKAKEVQTRLGDLGLKVVFESV